MMHFFATLAGQPSKDELVSMVAATMEAVRTAKAQLQAAVKDPKAA
jgi:hypothetical protein